MKLRMITTANGPATGPLIAGGVYTVADELAQGLIAAGAAVRIDEAQPEPAPAAPAVETAAADPVEEKATSPAAKRGRKPKA